MNTQITQRALVAYVNKKNESISFSYTVPVQLYRTGLSLQHNNTRVYALTNIKTNVLAERYRQKYTVMFRNGFKIINSNTIKLVDFIEFIFSCCRIR